MKKIIILFLTFFIVFAELQATKEKSVRPVKNVILMIPDGTSIGAVSLARWYQRYNNPEQIKLNLDPYLCGTVLTYSIDAPIGDSAPATSCYMTGYPSIDASVSTYPRRAGKHDILPVDTSRLAQPLITVMEAAKLKKGKATGLVVTCHFPHATPADCASHYPYRYKYPYIASQMVHNNVDIMFGGGVSFLTDAHREYLRSNGYGVFCDDIEGFKKYDGNKMWALFCPEELPYSLDADTTKIPTLATMTRKAIEKLSQNRNGFFLMVEGSKVDWAAHANDPVAVATEFLAFDKACGVALDFARKDGNTAVLILPDHGTGGVNIGNNNVPNTSDLTTEDLFGQLTRYRLTAEGMARELNSRPNEDIDAIFKEYAGYTLNENEKEALYNCESYKNSPIPIEQRKIVKSEKLKYNYSSNLSTLICQLYNGRMHFGYTTHSHTAEEVFMASYHPKGTRPTGMITNIEVNHYLCSLLGLQGELDKLTSTCFAKHNEVFKGYNCEMISAKNDLPYLLVNGNGKQLEIFPNTNVLKCDGKEIKLNSVVVYSPETSLFYLPDNLTQYLK